LKGKSFLLQQIEHGDYDPSDYYSQALDELRLCKMEQAKVTKSWSAGSDSLRDCLEKIERKYIKRYNKLMEDHYKEENRILNKLKEELKKEFVVDVWVEALKKDINQDLLGLYHNYKKIAYDKLQNTDQQSKELELEQNR
jgi:hypothetical protein